MIFKLILIIIVLTLLFAIIYRIIGHKVYDKSYYYIHIGLIIILFFELLYSYKGFFIKIKVYKDIENSYGYSSNNNVVKMPYSIELDDIKDVKAKISNKMLKTVTLVLREDNKKSIINITQNHPYLFSNSNIYLEDYDSIYGDNCILLIVYNPFQYFILIGIIIMLLGCIKMFINVYKIDSKQFNKNNHEIQ